MLAIGQRVETITAPPHPASFAGTVIGIGEVNGRILVRADDGVERVYTPESLRPSR
jgi:hypothetical protein